MRSIGTTLALQMACALVIVMSIFSGLDMYQRQQQEVSFLKAKEERIVHTLSLILGDYLFDVNIDPMDDVVRSFLSDPDILSISVSDDLDEILSSWSKEPTSQKILPSLEESFTYQNFDQKQADIFHAETDEDELHRVGTIEIIFSRASIDVSVQRSLYSVVLNAVLVVMFQILVVIFLVRNSIMKPLAKLVKISRKIALGQIGMQWKDTGTMNEIGEVMRAMGEMIRKLKEIIQGVKTTSVHMTHASQTMKEFATKMLQIISQQTTAVHETFASIQEITANIRKNAEKALQTKKVALNVAESAEESGKAVTVAMNAMQEIAKRISIVEEIARQTQLLSLNASIEAARAQQHGQGFSVVAKEVRRLAERSQQAAIEINDLVQSGVTVSEQAGQMITKLIPSIQETAELVQEISQSNQEQSHGMIQIGRSIENLNKVAEQSISFSKKVSSIADELTNQSGNLEDKMNFFQIENLSENNASPEKLPSQLPQTT